MKTSQRNPIKTGGFSSTELVVIIATVTILFLAFFLFSRTKKSAIICSNLLRSDGIAFREYANDHNNLLPQNLSTNEGGTLEYVTISNSAYLHFQAAGRYLNTTLQIVCPQDTRQAAASWENLANTNVSYFFGLDSKPNLPMSIVAGDRNITPTSSVILQASQSAPPSWIKSIGLHGDKGHLLFGDGHAEELDSAGLSNAVQRTGIATNRFAVP
jgi:prepilin-type processing-associated H-X9-DG protein